MELGGKGGGVRRRESKTRPLFQETWQRKEETGSYGGDLRSRFIAYLGYDLNKFIEAAEVKGQSGSLMEQSEERG